MESTVHGISMPLLSQGIFSQLHVSCVHKQFIHFLSQQDVSDAMVVFIEHVQEKIITFVKSFY